MHIGEEDGVLAGWFLGGFCVEVGWEDEWEDGNDEGDAHAGFVVRCGDR